MEKFRKNVKWYLLLFLFVANVLIWYAVFREERGGILTVAFLDVGQGDSIYIESPSGRQILVDGGPNKKVLSELSRVMPFYDHSIDAIVATHPDKDHIGGLPYVVGRYSTEYFLENGAVSSTKAYEALVGAVEESGIEKIMATRGMKIRLSDKVFMNILFPDRDVSGASSNDGSIVAQLVYGDSEFMLTGDSPRRIEKYLVGIDGWGLRSDVLKAGHHGSKTSSDKSFIGFVSPKYAVLSVGCENRYGHPHKETLDALSGFEIETLSTCKDGTIIFKSDGESVWREN